MLVQAGAIPPLLTVLNLTQSDSDPVRKLMEACARALKAMFQNPSVPRDDVFRVSYCNVPILIVSYMHMEHCIFYY
jgi:hypothetical protein